MPELISRLKERFLRRRTPAPSSHPATDPYACPYVGGPTAFRTGERPLRGEDSPLVRPYLLAHERRSAPRRALWIAA
ncbi:hypothetical protein ACFV9D_17470 [Streptomyces sp. NPDC059875]|uniref:hypothetical protein n=1 Tax=unclassified Streptomyces TaxID=2593676 RepID=UPI003654A791